MRALPAPPSPYDTRSAMILILLRYVKPIEEVEAHTAEHRAYMEKLLGDGKLIFSGPREPRVGGVILTTLDSEVEATKLIVDDPYFENGVAEYDVIRFNPNRHDPRFAAFMPQAAAK
jgi:uncharacterized protein YciI